MRYLLVIGDSRDMSEIETNKVDLVMTSPPYFAQQVYSDDEEGLVRGDLSRITEREEFFKEINKTWKECYRVLKPGGVIVVNWRDAPVGSKIYGYPRELCLVGDYVGGVEGAGFTLIARWIWWKYSSRQVCHIGFGKAAYTTYDNIKRALPRPVCNWEYCFAFYKRGWHKRDVSKLDFSREEWIEWSDGLWKIPIEHEKYEFTAFYPIELPRRFIKIYTIPGETVLDPFLGTGTTMKASFELQRSCIGYEVLEKMIPTIKSKTGWGSQRLDGEGVKWEVIRR